LVGQNAAISFRTAENRQAWQSEDWIRNTVNDSRTGLHVSKSTALKDTVKIIRASIDFGRCKPGAKLDILVKSW
jgi:hypothetical protein